MRHVSNPLSTSVPVDATAGPNLIPDLITKIPCECLEPQKWLWAWSSLVGSQVV